MNDLEGLDDTVLARIDGIVAAAVEQGQVPGVVAAVARGGATHVATAGVMTFGGRRCGATPSSGYRRRPSR